MNPYVNGNLALKNEPQHVVRKEKSKQVKRTTIPASEKLFYLGVILVGMVIAGAVLFQSAQLYAVNTKIQDIEREIQTLEKENQALQLEGEKLKEPQRLYELGKALGFIAPAENHVIPVSANKLILTANERKTAYLE